MDRGAWWATVHGVAKSHIQLSDFHFHSDVWTIALSVFKRRVLKCLPSTGTCMV